MILAEMAGGDDLLRGDARDVSALVGDQAVGPMVGRRVGADRDDRMDLQRRRMGQVREARQDRRAPLQLLDAGGQTLAEVFPEEVRRVLCDQPIVGGPQRVGQADQPRPEPLDRALVEPAAPMRRGDVDDAADRWIRTKDQAAAEELAIILLAHQLGDGTIADDVPESVAGLDGDHLGDQAAHAVADEHHPVESRVRLARIELLAHLVQVSPEQMRRVRDRVAGRVAERPELKSALDRGIGLKGFDHPVPRPRTGPEPMHENDRDFPSRIGLQQDRPVDS